MEPPQTEPRQTSPTPAPGRARARRPSPPHRLRAPLRAPRAPRACHAPDTQPHRVSPARWYRLPRARASRLAVLTPPSAGPRQRPRGSPGSRIPSLPLPLPFPHYIMHYMLGFQSVDIFRGLDDHKAGFPGEGSGELVEPADLTSGQPAGASGDGFLG